MLVAVDVVAISLYLQMFSERARNPDL